MDIEIKKLGSGVGLALIPAFIAYMLVAIAANAPSTGAIFLVLGLMVFSYIFYKKSGIKEQASSMFFVLAIEFLLSPLMFLIYTFVFASENTAGDAEAAGAAIGGIVLVGGAFFIGLPLAGVFYLISRRLGSD